MKTVEVQTDWIILSSLPFAEVEGRVKEALGGDCSYIKESGAPDVYNVRVTRSGLDKLASLPFIKRCLPSESELKLYFVEMESHLRGIPKVASFNISLEAILEEYDMDFDGEVLLCKPDGFWLRSSERMAEFVSTFAEVKQVTVFV